jgi:hypothetical protein
MPSIARTLGLRECGSHMTEVEGAELVLQVRHVGGEEGEVVRTVALRRSQQAAVAHEAPELASGLQVEPAEGMDTRMSPCSDTMAMPPLPARAIS